MKIYTIYSIILALGFFTYCDVACSQSSNNTTTGSLISQYQPSFSLIQKDFEDKQYEAAAIHAKKMIQPGLDPEIESLFRMFQSIAEFKAGDTKASSATLRTIYTSQGIDTLARRASLVADELEAPDWYTPVRNEILNNLDSLSTQSKAAFARNEILYQVENSSWQEALQVATELNNKNDKYLSDGVVDAVPAIWSYNRNVLLETTTSLEIMQESLNRFKDLKENSNFAYNKGALHARTKNWKNAQKWYRQAEISAKSQDDVANAYLGLMQVNVELNNLDNAEKYAKLLIKASYAVDDGQTFREQASIVLNEIDEN